MKQSLLRQRLSLGIMRPMPCESHAVLGCYSLHSGGTDSCGESVVGLHSELKSGRGHGIHCHAMAFFQGVGMYQSAFLLLGHNT